MKRLEETISRINTSNNDPSRYKLTVSGKPIHIPTEKEIAVIDAIDKIDKEYGNLSYGLHSALRWLVNQIKVGRVPICPK